MLLFSLADRQHRDVREIAEWPIYLINAWVAYYGIIDDRTNPKGGE